MRFTLLVPTLNEIEGMKKIMPKIKREWVDQIIVIDGNSTDGTIEYARSNNYEVIIQKKRGVRNAYTEAMGHITGEAVITFSPDGNSIPELIPELITKMEAGYDMVIVSRFVKGARSFDDTFITNFGNRLFTYLINLLYKARYTDTMVMFRAWRKDIFSMLDLDKESSYATEEKIFNTRVGVEPLLSIRAAKRGLKVADIPGDEPARIGGRSKLEILKWGSAYMFEIIRELFVWR